MPPVPRLAAIGYARGFDIDRLLVTVCKRLAKDGIRLGGLLQISTGAKGGCASTVHVVDLRTNTAFDIWEERGAGAKGCRLDERGLADAALVIEQAIADRVDLIIVNRFGRAESLGRGLFACFGSALSADVPVLTAVRAPYDSAWSKFHGGLGLELPGECAAVVSSLLVRSVSALSFSDKRASAHIGGFVRSSSGCGSPRASVFALLA